jgi:hypothetical protein
VTQRGAGNRLAKQKSLQIDLIFLENSPNIRPERMHQSTPKIQFSVNSWTVSAAIIPFLGFIAMRYYLLHLQPQKCAVSLHAPICDSRYGAAGERVLNV